MAVFNVHHASSGNDDFHDLQTQKDPGEAMRQIFGPGQVDQAVRSAIQACWMALPRDRRTIDEVEKEMRRLLDRAFANLREDAASFNLPPNT